MFVFLSQTDFQSFEIEEIGVFFLFYFILFFFVYHEYDETYYMLLSRV